MLTFCIWWWGSKYDDSYVDKLVRGIERNLTTRHRFVLVTDKLITDLFSQTILIDDEDRPLLDIKGCLARLRMFDVNWQRKHGLDGRLASVDLDTVITGDLDPVFHREETFCILHGANASNPCPYTGALFMLRCGEHREVWDDFSLEAVQRIPKSESEIPDDQGWLAHKLPGAAGWKAGEGGVYAFMKPGWPHKNGALPADARIVTFPGHRDPSQYKSLSWVQEHWS